jgi:recombination protein RecA
VGIDCLLGGGLPVGRLIEIYGQTHVGKSFLALTIAKTVQAKGNFVFICDSEECITEDYLLRAGLDPALVFVYPTSSLEQALSFYREVLSDPTNGGCCFIFDTVKGFLPKSLEDKLEEDPGAANMAGPARVWATNRSMLVELASISQSSVIFVNHISTAIGPYAPKDVRAGGITIPQIVSVTLAVKGRGRTLSEDLKSMPEFKGISIDLKAEKSRFGTMGLQTTLELTPTGYDNITTLIRMAKMYELAKGTGWYNLDIGGGEVYRVQGMGNLYTYLKERPEVCSYLRERIIEIALKRNLTEEHQAVEEA